MTAMKAEEQAVNVVKAVILFVAPHFTSIIIVKNLAVKSGYDFPFKRLVQKLLNHRFGNLVFSQVV